MKGFQYSNEGYPAIIPEEIKNILNDKCGLLDEEIRSDVPWECLGIDSLDVVEIVMETERVYEISLPDDEIEECYTLGDFVKLVNRIIKGED